MKMNVSLSVQSTCCATIGVSAGLVIDDVSMSGQRSSSAAPAVLKQSFRSMQVVLDLVWSWSIRTQADASRFDNDRDED